MSPGAHHRLPGPRGADPRGLQRSYKAARELAAMPDEYEVKLQNFQAAASGQSLACFQGAGARQLPPNMAQCAEPSMEMPSNSSALVRQNQIRVTPGKLFAGQIFPGSVPEPMSIGLPKPQTHLSTSNVRPFNRSIVVCCCSETVNHNDARDLHVLSKHLTRNHGNSELLLVTQTWAGTR